MCRIGCQHGRVAVLAAERERRVAGQRAHARRRRAMLARTAGRSGRPRLAQEEAAHDRRLPALAYVAVAGELGRGSGRRRSTWTPATFFGHAVVVDRVVEVDQRPLRVDDLHRGRVERDPRPSGRRDLRALVERCSRASRSSSRRRSACPGVRDEAVDVAVRVDAARPADRRTSRTCRRPPGSARSTNSVGSSSTSKPTSFSIAWITWPSRAATGSVPSIRLDRDRRLRPRTPRRASSPSPTLRVQVALQSLRRHVPRADRRDRVAVGQVEPAEDDLVDRRPVEREVERLRAGTGELRERRARRSSTAFRRPFLFPMLSVMPW